MKEIKREGFTIIEVVLVLAIAGMIFLMVFIVLPQMQRTQRDAARKEDMMIFVEAVKKFQMNSRGVLPDDSSNQEDMRWGWNADGTGDGKGFRSMYLEEKFADPEEDYYGFIAEKCELAQGAKCPNQDFGFDSTIHFYYQGACQNDEAVASSNPRDFAVVYRTESSGAYCFDSSS